MQKRYHFASLVARQHRFFKFCEPNDWLKTGREPGRLSEFVQEQPGENRDKNSQTFAATLTLHGFGSRWKLAFD